MTFTAIVSASSSGVGAPSGLVQFYAGDNAIGGPVSMAGPGAAVTTSALGPGTYAVTAVYLGDGTFNASTSAGLAFTVSKGDTMTALVGTPNPIVQGAPLTLTASVAAVSPATGLPTGSVTFKDGTTTLGSAALSAGVARVTTSNLTVGSHAITATYEGSASFLGSTSAELGETVQPKACADMMADAYAITGVRGTLLGTTDGATAEPGEPPTPTSRRPSIRSGASGLPPPTVPSRSTPRIAVNTVLAIYTLRSGDVADLAAMAANDNLADGFIHSRMTFTAVEGTSY